MRGRIEDYSTGSLVYQYFTGHREYTPGHWEDGNGNWINGKWNDWVSIQDGYQVTGDGTQFGDPDSWYFVHDGQPSAQLSKKSNLPIWSGGFSDYSKIALAERTWINNVPVA